MKLSATKWHLFYYPEIKGFWSKCAFNPITRSFNGYPNTDFSKSLVIYL
jgi:hypothetical protein